MLSMETIQFYFYVLLVHDCIVGYQMSSELIGKRTVETETIKKKYSEMRTSTPQKKRTPNNVTKIVNAENVNFFVWCYFEMKPISIELSNWRHPTLPLMNLVCMMKKGFFFHLIFFGEQIREKEKTHEHIHTGELFFHQFSNLFQHKSFYSFRLCSFPHFLLHWREKGNFFFLFDRINHGKRNVRYQPAIKIINTK